MAELTSFFRSMPTAVLVGIGITLVGLSWLVWSICRKVVRVGFFLFTLGLAFLFTYAANAVMAGPPSLATVGAEALALTYLWCAIRSRVARLVSIVALTLVIKAVSTLMPTWQEQPKEPSSKLERRIPSKSKSRTNTESD